eukprot:Lankesteria_metandrocarpae@DN1097_c0_g1_i2.p1
MKLIKRSIEKTTGGQYEGSVCVMPEELEDLWDVYNLINKGDKTKAHTHRKVQRQSAATGSVSSFKIKMFLCITAQKIEFDADAAEIRVSGRSSYSDQYIKTGQYHTLQLGVGREVVIIKRNWDVLHRNRLADMLSPKKRGELAAVMVDIGIANLFWLTERLCKPLLKIKVDIPKSRGIKDNHSKATERFYQQVYSGITQHLDLTKLNSVLIAGPGFTKDDLFDWIKAEAHKRGDADVTSNLSKFILTRASTPFKHSLSEILQNESVLKKLCGTKMSSLSAVLEEFYSALRLQPDKAYYGIQHVVRAAEQGAVAKLLVVESLFRSNNTKTRERYSALTNNVRSNGGEVLLFPDVHVAGESAY